MDVRRYQEGKPARSILSRKPADIPLCGHCQKAEAWMRPAL
jgi:hypothetical protein